MSALAYYQQLEGATIEAVELIPGGGAGDDLDYPAMLVRLPNGNHLQVEVQQDPEGNGPGHLAIHAYRP